MDNVILSVLAHPDDAEFLCGGTLIRLADLGWKVHIASMSPGDCGSAELPPDEIARVRRAEGASAAEVIGTGELPHWHRDGPGDFGHGPYPLGIEFERKLATAKRGAGFNP